MNPKVVVFDTGALQSKAGKVAQNGLLLLLEEGWLPLVPTVVLAEALTGTARDAPVEQFVNQSGTVDTTEDVARTAGRLRHRVARAGAKRLPSGIDALVAAHAIDVGAGVVLTTDVDDLSRLLVDHPRVAVRNPHRPVD